MADVFSNTGVAPIATSSSPSVNPSVDLTDVVDTKAQTNVVKAVTQGFKDTANVFGQITNNRNTTLISDFSTQQLKLAAAVDQGKLSAQEARIRVRANTINFTTDNPSLSGDAFSAVKGIIGTSGLGAVIARGTEQEQRDQRTAAAAQDGGYIPVNATQDQVVSGIAAYEKSLQIRATMKSNAAKTAAINDKLNTDIKRTNKQAGELALQAKVLEKESQQALVDMASTETVRVTNRLEQIIQDHKSGNIPNLEDAIKEMTQLQSQFGIATSELRAESGTAFGSAIVAPIDNIFTQYRKILTGELTVTEGNNNIKIETNKQNLMLLADPKLGPLIAANNLLGRSADVVGQKLDSAVIDFFKQNESDSPPNPLNTSGNVNKGTDVTTDIILENMDSKDPAVVDDVNKQLQGLAKGMSAYESFIKKPEDLDTLLSFFANDKTGRFLAKQDGKLPVDLATKLEDTISVHYSEQLYPLIRDEFKNAKVFPFDSNIGNVIAPFLAGDVIAKNAPDIINVDFRGSGVKFFTSSKLPDATKKVNELNNGLGVTLNRLIKVNAHVKGTVGGNAYKTEWELIKDQIGLGGPQKPVQSQGGSKGGDTTQGVITGSQSDATLGGGSKADPVNFPLQPRKPETPSQKATRLKFENETGLGLLSEVDKTKLKPDLVKEVNDFVTQLSSETNPTAKSVIERVEGNIKFVYSDGQAGNKTPIDTTLTFKEANAKAIKGSNGRGFLTLGIGHLITKSEWDSGIVHGVNFKDGLTDKEVQTIFNKDKAIHEAEAKKILAFDKSGTLLKSKAMVESLTTLIFRLGANKFKYLVNKDGTFKKDSKGNRIETKAFKAIKNPAPINPSSPIQTIPDLPKILKEIWGDNGFERSNRGNIKRGKFEKALFLRLKQIEDDSLTPHNPSGGRRPV